MTSIQSLLDRFEDILGVPSLEQQLEWHRRNPTPTEAPERRQGMVLDGMGNRGLANSGTLGALNVAMAGYQSTMARQLDNSKQLLERIAAEQQARESQATRIEDALAQGQAAMDRDIALLVERQRYEQPQPDYDREFARVNAPAAAPQRLTEYVTSQGRYLRAPQSQWVADDGSVLTGRPGFPIDLASVLPR